MVDVVDVEDAAAAPSPGLDREPEVRPADVRLAAMNLLARREHSRDELRRKLLKRFDEGDIVDEELARLSDENLQSDERYARSLLRQRVNRGHGPVRIRQEMRQKGVASADIDAAMQAEEVDWYARAEDAYRRKFGDLPVADMKEKARRMRFMQYRGFDVDHYQHLLDS